ncbi:hypothetical protein KUCAC02_022528, partial [Chaenocephalus aceratus]
MVSICPDCPNLISLHDADGMKSVKEAVQRVNENTTNQNDFILKDVGRIKIGWMMTTGSNYWAQIALVESHCPMGSRILPEACTPLCPERARHAYCRSSYSKSKGLGSVECEYYPPMSNRRRLWLQAIQRVDWNEDIIKDSRVCSAHFISGEASLDSSSPDFVPSVFMYTKQSQNPNAKMDRDILSLPPLCHSRYILLSHLAMIQGVAQK